MNTSTFVTPGSNFFVSLSHAVCLYDIPMVGNIITPSESHLMELTRYAALAVIVACLFISSTMSCVKNSFRILI
jgi:hypothetical protein